MYTKLGTGVLMIVLLISLTGTCFAADSPGYLATLTGGESQIVNGTDGMMVITLDNPDQKVNITKEDNTSQISVGLLKYAVLPIDAITIFSSPEMKTASIVKIENLSISDNNDNLTLKVKPLDYYDGEVLTSYAQDTVNLKELDEKLFNSTGLYLEMINNIPENFHNSISPLEKCIGDCHGDSQCIFDCDDYC
ncbi:hypothetical protein ACKUB1_14210 [Methanospirillum stamsii]|uniref:Uncharacterized protein n=1 Tax=Methanospirillum stamsii TaxID=1277351 RepID=A0A2V2NBU9_9EURY|nr:hypothetical protein [Methanospirillum stamsii]PWR76220.1 hypothetical protein DLD82_00670 [Methanospirillum stamsii]